VQNSTKNVAIPRSVRLKRTGKIYFLTTCFFVALISISAGAGQVRLDATVDRNELAAGDNVTLSLTLTSDQNISGDEEEPRLPTLDGFELLNKWSETQASSVFENGKFSFVRKQIYRYTLTPEKAGEFKIGAAEIHVNGQVLTSNPITIKVLAAGSPALKNKVAKNGKKSQGAFDDEEEDMGAQGGPGPGGGNDDDEDDIFNKLLRRRGLIPNGRGGIKTAPKTDSNDAFFVSVEANKKKVYVGEEIVASWYIYTKGAIQSFDALKYPDLKGFWKEDLEQATRLNFSQEIVNGVPYSKALLVSYALFPIGPGQKLIDSYKAKATVVQLDSGLSMFGIGHPYTYVKVSKELPIEVVPLPTEGRPASFSGAVGHFAVTGSLSATSVKVNQPVSLKIRFSGEGNVKAIDLPPLDLPKNLEVYDTKKDSQFNKNGEGFKEFEVLIIPRAQGEITIPSIPVSFFDPKAGKYVSQATPTFNLKVLPGEGQNNFSSPMTQNENQQSSKDVRYLKTSPSIRFSPASQKVFWIILYLSVYGWFAWQIWKIYSGRTQDSKSMMKKIVRLKLKAAQLKFKAGDLRGVGVESSNAVLNTLGEISGVGGVSLTIDQMLNRLPKNTEVLQVQIQKFLNRCEILSFAPKELSDQLQKNGSAEVKNVIGDAEKIISDLFELAEKEKSSGPAAASATSQKTS
jgi:hypothetical protein